MNDCIQNESHDQYRYFTFQCPEYYFYLNKFLIILTDRVYVSMHRISSDSILEMEIVVDQRVVIKQSDNQFPLATVKWIGELPDKKGKWFGIVYDEPYGKHDGMFNGHSYFSCPAPYGSFVREPKILSELDLETAIKIQYTRDFAMEELAGVSADSKVFFNDKPIDSLLAVSVNDLPIRKMKKGCLNSLCPRLKSFDCSHCPVDSWDEIHNAIQDSNIRQLTCSRMKPNFASNDLIFSTIDTLRLVFEYDR